MTDYNDIAEYLQEQVDLGEMTLEEAQHLNDVAYETYVENAEDDDVDNIVEAEEDVDNSVEAEAFTEAVEYLENLLEDIC